MKQPLPFDVQDRLWNEALQSLSAHTDHDAEDLRRGLTFMVGRRVGEMLQTLADETPDELLAEIDVAIRHSREEK